MQRTFTQEEFRKELLEGTDPFLVDPMELSKESLDVLEQVYNTTGFNFKDIVLTDIYIRKGNIKEVSCITSKISWAGKSYYEDAQHYIIKVLPEKTMNRVTDREKLQSLLDGKVLAYGRSKNLHKALHTDGMLKYCTKDKVFDEEASSIIDLTEASLVTQWYEDIPEGGVLCFTWDGDTGCKIVQRVIKVYGSGDRQRFANVSGYSTEYAIPLSCEQIVTYSQLMGDAHAL